MKYDIVDNFALIKDIPCELKYGNYELLSDPEISVVVPTFKRPDLLEETIDSIVRQKNADFRYEIIVVDNDDESEPSLTESLIRRLNIPNLFYYKNQRNIGGVGNWNRCILLARSKWVVMCHDDDMLKPDCLSTMHKIIQKHRSDKKEIGYVRSSAESFYEEGIKAPQRKKSKRIKKDRTAIVRKTYSDVIWGGGATWAGSPTCGTLLNRDAVIAVGGYNELHSPCPDCYVPYNMLGKYGVYATYYSCGLYRWGQNDTYRKSTLLGLISAYYEFLKILSVKEPIVRFFAEEHYADCVNYYLSKGEEAGVSILREEIDAIHPLKYTKIKLKLLYLFRKANNFLHLMCAK